MCPIAQTDGHDAPGLIEEGIPGAAAMVDDIVVGFEDAVRQPVDGVDGAPTASKVPRWMLSQIHLREPSMGKSNEKFAAVTRVGLDLAKNVFQVHAVDIRGDAVITRKVRRSALLEFFGRLAPCVVAMEACASAHHWGRLLIEIGHEVRLIPPAHVKPYVRRNKNDAADAAAICEAALRPGQRFVTVRSVENQAELMRHRVREQLSGQRTGLLNALRGHLSEIGVVAAQGAQNVYGLKRLLIEGINEEGEVVVPEAVRMALKPLAAQIDTIDETIGAIDEDIGAAVKADARARRLMSIPGIGPVIASAIISTIPDMSAFSSGREFAAFLGLTPRQHSSGGKERLGRITKMGDRYLRKLLVVGATSVLCHSKGHNDALRRWARAMLERKMVKYAFKLTAVALANKLARVVFALLRSGGVYDDRPVAA
jgi:transposase